MGNLSQNHLQSRGSIWNVVQPVETFDAVFLWEFVLLQFYGQLMEIREGPCGKTGPVTKTSPLVRRELQQAAARKIMGGQPFGIGRNRLMHPMKFPFGKLIWPTFCDGETDTV